jgi:heme/copper-type cytochrome/quinol oxidase subunit 1
MTVTEAPSDVHVADTQTEQAPPTGLAALVGTGDPRTIGKLFVASSLAFAVGVGAAGLVAGIDLTDGNRGDSFGQVLTFHQVGGLLLVVLPLLLGLAHAVVPLQAGSSTVAFPRASAASYWGWLASGGLLVGAYVADGGLFGEDIDALGLSILALVGLVASLCAATVSVMATALALRAPGMTLRRLPTFSWSMVVGGTVWLLTLPVMAGLLVIYHVDIRYGGGSLFGGTPGGHELWDQIRWVFWQPALYAVAIPALGIIGDIVPVFARRRPVAHGASLFAIGLFGVVSFGAWTQFPPGSAEMVEPGEIDWLYSGTWGAVSVVAVLPVLVLLGLWTLNLISGRPRIGAPLLLSLAAGLMLLIGVAAGVPAAIEASELAGTTWTTGQAYLVLVATFTAAVGGVVMWAPKLYGKLVPGGLGIVAAPVLLVGGLLAGVGYAVAGIFHQPLELGTRIDQGNVVEEQDTVEFLNLLAAVGIGVVLAGAVIVILALLATAGSRKDVGDDPWGGHTLEWTVSSPPPVGNFATLPEVSSEAPHYDRRHAEAKKEVSA